ncbi:unnamed protein product [Rhizophagus irregularis]|nr:unnamed protein product [Rhizophagus irregularis]
MQEYDKLVTNPINPSLYRQYAYEWLQCNSKSSRDTHFKEHSVKWSELLHLPYMNPIRFANPPKIAIENEGFSNLTADQWKTFIMIYFTPILWDMLDNNDRKILGHFVRACNFLVARFITEDDLREAQERLAHLIERTYGPEFITSNIHLALHIPDCCHDYGFIYSFWLFPYERLNGYIGKIWSKQKLLSLRTINKETETTRKVEIEEGDFEQRPNTLQKNIQDRNMTRTQQTENNYTQQNANVYNNNTYNLIFMGYN